MRVFLLSALLIFLALPALAQGIVEECGAPTSYNLDTETVPNYCDIHSRRLSYAEEQKAFHEQLRERQQNFIAPSTEAHENYQENIEALRKNMGHNASNE